VQLESRNKYTVNGPKPFKSNTAIELQVDTDVLVGPAAGTSTRTFNYFNITATEALYYGTIAEITAVLPVVGSFTTRTTASYNPAWRVPLTLGSGMSFSNNASAVTIETAGFGGSTTTVNQTQTVTYRFLGIENVSVPAGTFSTCKVETVTAYVINGVQSTGTSIQWTIASGDLRGLFVKSQSENGQTSEAKLVQIGH
jgi:hypothetical protein